MSRLLDFCYLIAYLLAMPWIFYRLISKGGWRALPRRLGAGLGAPLPQSIWLHGSSIGEISLIQPLVTELEEAYPGVPLVISANTAAGIEAARVRYARHRVVAFPLDFKWIIRRYFARFNPKLIVIAESEFWPNFLITARRRAIPVALVNGRMSPKSFRMHSLTRLIPHALRTLDLIAVQSEENASRMRMLGVAPDRVVVTGNMKYDLAPCVLDVETRDALRTELGFGREDVVVVAASLHDPEEKTILAAFDAVAARYPRAALVLVPRYPEDAGRVVDEVRARGRTAVCKTAIDKREQPAPGRRGVLVVDTVGQLAGLYSVADIAFVGGSLYFRGSNRGGHNLMEPAVYGVPVLFGPYNFSFRETAHALSQANAGMEVDDAQELAAALTALLDDSERRLAMGRRARQVISDGRGATKRTFGLLRCVIDRSVSTLAAS
jgi:3-deoxy-D-manno-octulosonic-acid transferase